MKKIIILFLLAFVFAGCTYNIANPPKVKELDPVAMFGVKGRPLEGRLFLSSCESNAFGNMDSAKRTALKNAAKKARKLGYKYFTVIDRDARTKRNKINYTTYDNVRADTQVSAFGPGGYAYGDINTNISVPVTQTMETEFQTYEFIFFLLDENEIDGWDNIYSVAKYL